MVLDAGTNSLSVTFTPNDANYNTCIETVNITVLKATAVVSWSTPSDVTYGTALSATQLNATSTVQGTFVYTPAAGVVLDAGTHALSVTFTPTDANYTSTTKTVSLDVLKATAVVTWATPADVTYGSALGATQLNATSGVQGTFAYTPAAGVVLDAGTHALSVTFTPTDANYTATTKTVSLDVLKAAAIITWPTPANVTYGTALSATQLNATSSVQGTFVYTPAAGVGLDAGTHALSVTFTPTDANYTATTKRVSLDVLKTTALVTWATPADVTYGTALGATQLNATSALQGTFTYTPAAGVVLDAGTHALSVTFTPTDANYTATTKTVSLDVLKATAVLTWPTPASVTYGTALSATQLNATSTVQGTLAYTPAAGVGLDAGTHALSVTFTPTDANYTATTKRVSLDVLKTTALVTWATPADVTYGPALGATQLNATSALQGTFTYTPAAGVVLDAGTHALSVTFTPTDANYTATTKTVSLDVLKATAVITWPTPASVTYGTALSGTQLNATSSVQGTFVYTPAAAVVLDAGTHALSVTFTPTDANYTATTKTVSLDVLKTTAVVTWATPADVTYGSALGATQLNATSGVQGTFAYTPAAGVVLDAGTHALSVTFTPTDANYTATTKTVSLDVLKATAIITWPTPASVTYGTALSATQLNATSSVQGTF